MPFRPALLLGIVVLFSLYSFGYTTLDAGMDYKVMLVLASLGGSAALLPPRPALFSKPVLGLYLLFLGLTTFGVFLPVSEHANVTLLIESLAMLGLSTLIVIGFAAYTEQSHALLKWGWLGCLGVLAGLIILHQSGLPIKKLLPTFAGFRPIAHDWNQKHFSFWLIFLMWGVIAQHWKKGALNTALSIGVMALTGFALSLGYSDSAPLAFGLSLVIFALMHIRSSVWLRIWQAGLGLYVFSFPWLWLWLPERWFALIKSIPFNNVHFRVDLYRFTADLISKHWLGGYGFGSAAPLLRPFPLETGGHPHNIVLYFWLELGLFGALVLALVLMALFRFVHTATHHQPHAPAVWALVGAGLVIFSFSFDIWLPGIVLIYAMWLAMIRLASRSDPHV